MMDVKAELLGTLRSKRAVMLGKLDGLPEYDQRRPLVSSGTNLLGLVKHLAGLEYGYLGESFGRPPRERPSWWRENPYDEIDMWATPDESSDYIIGVYQQAAAHADRTVDELEFDSPGRVKHWGDRETTLGALLIRMVGETAQHAGHADIVRELIDGGSGNSQYKIVQEAADVFRTLES